MSHQTDREIEQGQNSYSMGSGLRFDKTINLGHLISIVIMLAGLISIISKVNDMQSKVNMMWNDFAKTKGICCPVSLLQEPSWWDRFVTPVAAKELNR